MTSIHDILAELRASATDERDKGDLFERLMVAFLATDPLYAQRYAHVWRWADWPDRPHGQDAGIDLVAEERDTGQLCAIQCKFYDPAHVLQKADIDSFFTASGKAVFSSRMIISTTDNWSKHAEEALEGQQVPVARLRVQDLDDSAIDWSQFRLAEPDRLGQRKRRNLRPHQRAALTDVSTGFAAAGRGKLIMACGTGKTFASLRIAEHLVPESGSVLFLAPSISLVSQSLKEWSREAAAPMRTFAVCSDVKVGKRTKSEDIGAYDLAYPATTDAVKLHAQLTAAHGGGRTVVFATYQSLKVIAEAQKRGVPAFDLVICDEAHRTTGVTLADDDESTFVRIHDADYVHATKRLYMTATPRIYDDSSKTTAQEGNAVLCSMDDESVYGPEFHRLGFGEAVGKGLLTDYKVLVLAVDEEHISKVFQSQLADKNNELQLEDRAKIVGCWNALAKRGVSGETLACDPRPMRRAVAFARSIDASKHIEKHFAEVVNQYVLSDVGDAVLRCDVKHVDGTFNALVRNERLDWLRSEIPEDAQTCRILSNAKCLSEGVDVPGLDAVLFLNPRNSVVDVVQSVGRVMRLAEGKEYGYVILPIAIPASMTPEEALRDNKKYRVVWQVLQALRAHDDRFNSMVNKIELNRARDDRTQVIGVGAYGERGDTDGAQTSLPFPQLAEWRDAIYAKMVQKVGDRRYWESWAQDVAAIAGRNTSRIRALLSDETSEVHARFAEFVAGLRATLNESITTDDAINMLSQHLITRPVFDALFADYSFAESNPVSVAMQTMVDALDAENIGAETETLDRFYESVRERAAGIDNAEGKQRIIAELYEKFFKTAFPQAAASLGIVYTPVEVVDFIINSVQSVLHSEFGASLADRGVHVLDPFTGTGTFIVRLLQSGLIPVDALSHKYKHELHANEIVLLAYYIAAINIEAAYHDVVADGYQPFQGIVLTDTFQMYEHGDTLDDRMFPQNNERAQRQKNTDIRVIIGNPPYSVGQGSENDANKNLKYVTLDEKVRRTYAARSSAGLKRNLYDSYIRAFRYASDRIKDRGVVCFVSNGSHIDSGSADGFRRTLTEEFSSIYCVNLRGNARTSGEPRRKESGSIFGEGTRTPIAITLLVKDSAASGPCRLHYHDIGDYLSRERKLEIVRDFGSVDAVPWEMLVPDTSGDWINLRDDLFESFAPLGDKRGGSPDAMFDIYSQGVLTARDAWAYNFDRAAAASNIKRMIEVFNDHVRRFARWAADHAEERTDGAVERFVERGAASISWTGNLKAELRRDKPGQFVVERLVPSVYRPFCKQWLYFDRQLNERVYQLPKLFPTPEHRNLVIAVTGGGAAVGFSALITDSVPNYHLHDTGQAFPLYRYEQPETGTLFAADADASGYTRRNAVTDRTLTTYRRRHGGDVTKEDIFYYVYGILHSPDYRTRFASDLKKMIPRIPMVDDFAAFCAAGRELAKWHLGYETVDPWPLTGMPSGSLDAGQARVSKMRFGKAGREDDRTMIVFNSVVTLSNIPLEAYEYEVNGKSAIEWIMDRYQLKTDKDSGILNDPNTWSDDPRYVLDLVARIVRVSVATVEIVRALPALESIHEPLRIAAMAPREHAAAPAAGDLVVADADDGG